MITTLWCCFCHRQVEAPHRCEERVSREAFEPCHVLVREDIRSKYNGETQGIFGRRSLAHGGAP